MVSAFDDKKVKNNKIDVEATIKMSQAFITDNPETLKNTAEIAKECANLTGENFQVDHEEEYLSKSS